MDTLTPRFHLAPLGSALGIALLLAGGCGSGGSGTTRGAGGAPTMQTGGSSGAGAGGSPTGAGSGGSSTGTGATLGTGGSTSDTGGTAGGTTTGGVGGMSSTGGTAGGGTGNSGGGMTGSGGSQTATGGSGGASCPGGPYSGTAPETLTLSGSLGAHDPGAYVDGTTIYLGVTGLGFKTSSNLTTWSNWPGGSFGQPAWIGQMVPGVAGLWAPDISNFGGLYHLYYAGSTFGSNRSCIGQATRSSLSSGSWTDQGTVICSNVGTSDNWNAIDPNIVLDDDGTPWLVLGSFWSGIKAVKLDSTGKRADTMVYSLANHSNGGIEGAWVFKRCGYYYLFVSWGACCSGAYDYNMRVGRATAVTGPYADKAGTQMMSGGGTLLVQGNASWGAPGHNAVIVYDNRTYNVYHALQGGRGAPTLRISEILWDADGWPVSGGP